MSIPAYLDSATYAYSYYEEFGLADVETGGVGIITRLRAMLIALGWTEPSTALFKTPVDAAGRFLDVLVTRISSTVLEWRVRNQAGVTLCTRRITLNGSTVRYFCSTMGVLVEVCIIDPNASEILSAHVLDMAPDLTTDHSLYCLGGGYRNSAGTQDSQGNASSQYFAIDNGTAGMTLRGGTYSVSVDGNVQAMIDMAGRFFLREMQISINFAGTFRWAGRLVHALNGPADFGGGTERAMYIDTNTVATFKSLGFALTAGNQRMMMRKG